MRPRDYSGTVALCASLLLHGATLYICADTARRSLTQQQQHPPAADRAISHPPKLLVENAKPPEPPAPLAMPQLPLPAPRPIEPEPLTLLAQPKPLIPKSLTPQEPPPLVELNGFGELTGTPDATALHSLPGDVPMQAREAPFDQAYVSRDPVGRLKVAPTPAKTDLAETEKPGEAREAGEAVVAKPTPQQEPVPKAVAERKPAPVPKPSDLPGPNAANNPSDPTPPVQIAMATPPPKAAPTPKEPEPKNPGQPGSPQAAASPSSEADAAPLTDSEADPFAQSGSAEFRAGRVVARFGRKVKTVRPRLSLPANYDLMASPSPKLVLRVRVDETGKVRDTTIVKSSGSPDADHACQLVLYEWWFEPPRNKAGQPQPAEFLWTFIWLH